MNTSGLRLATLSVVENGEGNLNQCLYILLQGKQDSSSSSPASPEAGGIKFSIFSSSASGEADGKTISKLRVPLLYILIGIWVPPSGSTDSHPFPASGEAEQHIQNPSFSCFRRSRRATNVLLLLRNQDSYQ